MSFWEHGKTTKTKTTLSTKRVFGVFCFQEQKTVLENTKQTDPKNSSEIKTNGNEGKGVVGQPIFVT